DNLLAHPVAAVFAIASKFLIRYRGKHLLNPANGAVIASLLFVPGTWVSAGQWGQDVALAAWLVVLGALVAGRARRADVSWIFLAFHLGALGLRILWLGQRPAVWLHQLENGALLLFAFFMISDPMTAPNHVRGRVAHAAAVTAIAYLWQYALYETNALLWALFLASPLVPLWDFIWAAPKYEWNQGGSRHASITTVPSLRRARRGAPLLQRG
ncbi:MAG: RnfABCDGE type electron transport complex subunit D, partial [Candidatus Binatia bacterium]